MCVCVPICPDLHGEGALTEADFMLEQQLLEITVQIELRLTRPISEDDDGEGDREEEVSLGTLGLLAKRAIHLRRRRNHFIVPKSLGEHVQDALLHLIHEAHLCSCLLACLHLCDPGILFLLRVLYLDFLLAIGWSDLVIFRHLRGLASWNGRQRRGPEGSASAVVAVPQLRVFALAVGHAQ